MRKPLQRTSGVERTLPSAQGVLHSGGYKKLFEGGRQKSNNNAFGHIFLRGGNLSALEPTKRACSIRIIRASCLFHPASILHDQQVIFVNCHDQPADTLKSLIEIGPDMITSSITLLRLTHLRVTPVNETGKPNL